MSTTSFFYHTLGTQNYQYLKMEYVRGKVYVHLKKREGKEYCTNCKSHKVSTRDKLKRDIQTLPMGKKKIILRLHLRRLYCKNCKSRCLEAVEVADAKKRYSRKLASWVLQLLKSATIKDVAEISGLSWDQVKNIEKEYLNKNYRKLKPKELKQLEYIAIDEFYIGKKRKYLTFVTDLKKARIIFVAEGKNGESLKPFFKKIKKHKVQIKAASIDMGRAYIAALMEHLPLTEIVFDHFHVVKLVNSKIDKLRKQLSKEAETLGTPVQKGIRWAILKNPENLTDKQQSLLQQLLQFNTPLAKAYILKEQLRAFWSFSCSKKAESFLKQWIQDVRSIGSSPMNTLAKTIEMYSFGLLNYFQFPISSGMMEGLNNKIATLSKRAYGFRDLEYFKLKIKAVHETRYALVG